MAQAEFEANQVGREDDFIDGYEYLLAGDCSFARVCRQIWSKDDGNFLFKVVSISVYLNSGSLTGPIEVEDYRKARIQGSRTTYGK